MATSTLTDRKDYNAMGNARRGLTLLLLAVSLTACKSTPEETDTPIAQKLGRRGDEIVIAGQLFHTNAPVVLWTDPGGFDAYRTDRRFAKYEESSHNATTQQAKEIYERTGKAANFAETASSPQRLRLRSA